MKKIKYIFLILIFMLTSFCFAEIEDDEYIEDFSDAYFNYLIDRSEYENAYREKQKQELENSKAEITLEEEPEIIEISDENAKPFKLKIEQKISPTKYSEAYKKVDSKTIIPVANKVDIIQNLSKSRNKYSSYDYRILVGGEYKPLEFLNVASGVETNFRGIDQNPASRKLYFSPSIKFNDKISLGFYNKINVQTYEADHDIGLNISPLKSKAMDFGVYTGLTRKKTGATSESINFSTNFYLF